MTRGGRGVNNFEPGCLPPKNTRVGPKMHFSAFLSRPAHKSVRAKRTNYSLWNIEKQAQTGMLKNAYHSEKDENHD